MLQTPRLIKQFVNFFIPTSDNNYHPYGLRRTALFIYSIFLLIINLLGSTVNVLGVSTVSASSISTTRLIEFANKDRKAVGLVELKTNSQLQLAAKRKAEDMFAKGYWSHYGPNGETPWQFILGTGYSYTYAGENLAKDFVSTDAIHAAWMASPTHRANILKSQYRDIGIAAVSGNLNGSQTTIVVQMFGLKSEEKMNSSDLLPATTELTGETSELTPVITYPQEGGYYNDSMTHIKGKGKAGSEISIISDGEKVGTLSIEGGIFDFRPESEWKDGDHEVSSTARDVKSGVVSGSSNVVGFSIDTKKPEIKEESVKVETVIVNNNAELNIKVEVSSDVTSVKLAIGEEEYLLYKEPQNEDENSDNIVFSSVFDVSKEKLESNNYDGILKASDAAGNASTIDVDLKSSGNILINALGLFNGNSSALADLANRYNSLSFVSKINLMFAGFVSVLFTTDAVALWKMGIIRDGAKSLLSAFVFVVVILIGVFVGGGSAII